MQEIKGIKATVKTTAIVTSTVTIATAVRIVTTVATVQQRMVVWIARPLVLIVQRIILPAS